MTFIRWNTCLRSGMTDYGNARYVAAHCRGVIILISRCTYSPVRVIYPDNFQNKKPAENRAHIKKGSPSGLPFSLSGAGEESRTLDLNLGKVALYQLSYSRIERRRYSKDFAPCVKRISAPLSSLHAWPGGLQIVSH